jgi:hypothetical protein
MDNFDDPNETKFTATLVGRIRRAIIPGVGVVLRFETILPPEVAADQTSPVYQLLLTIPAVRELIEGLRHSVDAAAALPARPPKSHH